MSSFVNALWSIGCCFPDFSSAFNPYQISVSSKTSTNGLQKHQRQVHNEKIAGRSSSPTPSSTIPLFSSPSLPQEQGLSLEQALSDYLQSMSELSDTDK